MIARALLRLWARRAPLLHRKRWAEEWEAELQELERRIRDRPSVVRSWITARFALGARAHAAALEGTNGTNPTGILTMTMMGRDFLFAMRSFARTPGFTVLATLTLALGIGATTTMFSVLDGVLLRPLPYPRPDELVMVGSASQRIRGLAPASPADFRDWRTQNTTFTEMVATEGWTLDLTDGDAPVRVSSAAVTANFFELLGVAPMLGRTIGPSDDISGAEPVVVISHGLWERRYGADPGVVGTRITTADRTFTVAGVMPKSFVHPEALWSEDVEIWFPSAMSGSDMETRNGRFLQVIGRLAAGTTLPQARHGREALAEPLQAETIGDVGRALMLLMGAVGMLLLIACVNVANLFMARAAERGREIALRTALGAGTARIRSQLLTEGVSLSLVGGTAGVGLAYAAVWAFRAINPGGIPRVEAVTVDARILGFALVVSVLTGVAFALVPALRLARSGALDALKEGGRSGTDGRARGRSRYVLVGLELSLAVMLMVGAGLFVNSLLRLRNVHPGFDAEDRVTMAVNLHAGYGTDEQQSTFFRQLTERLEAVPGTRSVAYTSALPFGGDRWLTGIRLEGREADPANPDVTEYSRTSPGFFSTMGIDVVAGREFALSDDAGADPVTMVNEAFVRRYWPGEDGPGQRIGMGRGEPVWYTVIGVVGDINRRGLDRPASPEMYMTTLQAGINSAQVVVHTQANVAQTVAAMRRAVADLDGALPLHFSTLEEYVVQSTNQPRFYTQLFSAFAAVALLLAGVGVYGTMSYTVGQRTRELGIRMALGAQSSQVLGMVARQGMIVAGMGLTVGVIAALAGAKILESFLFGVSARDPLTYAGGASLLGLVALVACYVPARRAGRADPMRAIRSE
jgi:putative ABC transport system permease protein